MYVVVFFAIALGGPGWADADDASALPKTQVLDWDDDIASRIVAGADQFLLRKLELARQQRHHRWDRIAAGENGKQLETASRELARILGVRDERRGFDAPELVATVDRPALVGQGRGFGVFAVRWPAFNDVHGEGLLLVPTKREPRGNIVAIPDADQTPEVIVGLTEGVAPASQFARRLAEQGFRVLVPVLINREVKEHRRAKLTNREFIYRSAFELGRHVIGYELQKILAGVDWFSRSSDSADRRVGVIGWGEGGLLAFYAAAIDARIDVACVSGFFGSREDVWQQPIDRNVFGLLEQFGDAEVATLIAQPHRTLIIEAAAAPEFVIPPKTGGAPGNLTTPSLDAVRSEITRARQYLRKSNSESNLGLVVNREGHGPYGSNKTLEAFDEAMTRGLKKYARTDDDPPVSGSASRKARHLRKKFDQAARQQRQVHELDRHNQWLLSESPYVRDEFFAKLDTTSLETFEKTVEQYRDYFRHEVIGEFEDIYLPANPRSRKVYDEPGFTGYEVVLDVFPDVIAYGILLLPKDIPEGQQRPVVVCQHGLEGRPQDLADPAVDHRAYHTFACRLAERGFITFAPQNLYIFEDRFRTLQRKANPLKKTLFSIIVPQHRRITEWLASLPQVDPDRIAFYGLSYGGKTAMRVPPLVERYCLSICSADFNEWVWKNASSRSRYSYVGTKEYEIFEFDLGSTFNYAEMATLIAPRPFMVERGHFDGVSSDQAVAYEFAKVRHLYAAKLGIADRCEIEFFVGPHTINGDGTFAFLHKHLDWPEP